MSVSIDDILFPRSKAHRDQTVLALQVAHIDRMLELIAAEKTKGRLEASPTSLPSASPAGHGKPSAATDKAQHSPSSVSVGRGDDEAVSGLAASVPLYFQLRDLLQTIVERYQDGQELRFEIDEAIDLLKLANAGGDGEPGRYRDELRRDAGFSAQLNKTL